MELVVHVVGSGPLDFLPNRRRASGKRCDVPLTSPSYTVREARFLRAKPRPSRTDRFVGFVKRDAGFFFAMIPGVGLEDSEVQFVTWHVALKLAPELVSRKSEFATVADTHNAEQEVRIIRPAVSCEAAERHATGARAVPLVCHGLRYSFSFFVLLVSLGVS